MAFDKNGKPLPKGIAWLEKKQLYMGRFMYQGISYTLYDKKLHGITKKLAEKRYEAEHGLCKSTSKLTLNNWFEIWLNNYKSPNLKKTTLQNYLSLYNNHLRNTLGTCILSQIKPIHIQQLYNDFLITGHSATSLQTLHSLLHNIFEVATRNDLITKNPCLATVRPTACHHERQVLTLEEQNQLLTFIQQEKWNFCEPIITTLLGTGIRIGELLGLKWEDIDFEKKTISINRTLVYTKNEKTGKFGFEMQSPKTRHSKRILPMHPNVESALKRQFNNQQKLRQQNKWKTLRGFETLIFTGYKGHPLLTASVQNMLNRLVADIQKNSELPLCNIKHLHPHMMRHSFATRCFEADIPPKTVQTLLGHSNIQMTLDLYTHVSEEKKLKDMQKLISIL